MRKPWTIIVVVVVVVAALIGGDQIARIYTQQRIANQIESQYGGQADVRLGGWPFASILMTKRLADAQATMTGIEVSNEDKKATVESVDVSLTGLSPVDDLDEATAEHVDATATISWNQLSVLLGFPIRQVGDGRVEVKTSVQALQRVIPIVLEADLALQPDGTLVLSDPSISVADVDVPLPTTLLQLALEQLSPELKLPTPGGLSYQDLTLDADSVTIRLTGNDIAVAAFR